MKEPTFEFDPSAMFLENIQYYASEPGVHSASAARKFDQITIENFHIPSLVLMENAARGMADRIIANYPKAKKIAVLCGPGNNGGDGLALARILYLKGYRVAILLKADSALSDDETVQFESCLALNIQLYPLELFVEDYRPFDESYDLYVDALFGSDSIALLAESTKKPYALLTAVLNLLFPVIFQAEFMETQVREKLLYMRTLPLRWIVENLDISSLKVTKPAKQSK